MHAHGGAPETTDGLGEIENDIDEQAPHRRSFIASIGGTVLIVGSALAASLFLIMVAAALVMCWDVHPLLSLAVVPVIGLVLWLIGKVLFAGKPSTS